MKMEFSSLQPDRKRRRIVITALVAINLLLSGLVAFWFLSRNKPANPEPAAALTTATSQEVATSIPVLLQPQLEIEVTPVPTLEPGSSLEDSLDRSGALVLSMADGYYNHLFIYHPELLPLTRLTNDPFDDISPAVSPDSTRIAFSSRRNGYWDLHLFDLASNSIERITDTLAYEGSPSWSPDGKWLAYEAYQDGNLDIFIMAVGQPSQAPIQITSHAAADYAPAWSPDGRTIAFISQRGGEPDVWLVDLDENSNQFTNISQTTDKAEDHPDWSPDGRYLAWGSSGEGSHLISLWDSQNPDKAPLELGAGFWPSWSPAGDMLASGLLAPNHHALGGYNLLQGTLAFPANRLPGNLYGLDWGQGQFARLVLQLPFPENAAAPSGMLWSPALSANPMPPEGRFGMVPLNDMTAPYPYLVDLADEAFDSLRAFTAQKTGWDFLSSLENAYLPLSEPPTLAAQENWLYTGRAFAFNPVPLNAGWISLVKENINGQTYWRVFLKTRYQDGSQGTPITSPVWDIQARYNDDPRSYELGGLSQPVPAGYWIDFTDLAARFNWERLPAQLNWRTFINAARFNQFVLSGGLTWQQAMNEIFPPEALITPTSVPSLTPMPTPTPKDSNWYFYTSTPTVPPTPTPLPRPTWTPLP